MTSFRPCTEYCIEKTASRSKGQTSLLKVALLTVPTLVHFASYILVFISNFNSNARILKFFSRNRISRRSARSPSEPQSTNSAARSTTQFKTAERPEDAIIKLCGTSFVGPSGSTNRASSSSGFCFMTDTQTSTICLSAWYRVCSLV
jgi:hypothetical protein